DAAFGQHTAEIHVWVNETIASDNGSGIDHRVAADLGSVADDCAELRESSRDVAFFGCDCDLAVVEFHIRQNHAGAEVRFESESGTPHVVERWDLRLVEDDAVLEFAGVAHDHAVADHNVLAHVAAAPDLAIFSYPRRSFDYRPLFDNRATADKNIGADERTPDELAEHRRFQTKLQIAGDLFESVPDKLLVFEQLRMGRVFEAE